MTAVSVPCPSCSAAIHYGRGACPSCRRPVPRQLREALEARLEAMSEDFRDLKAHAGRAAIVLLVVAILHAGFGIVRCAVELSAGMVTHSRNDYVEAFTGLFGNLVVGAVMLGCFAWARRVPVPALSAGLIFWLGAQVLTVVLGGLVVLSIPLMLGKIVATFVLVRGILSARKIPALAEQLAGGEDQHPAPYRR